MNMKTMEEIAKSFGGKWYFNIKDTAELLGCTYQIASIFLKKNGVATYKIMGKSKLHFLPNIIEAIEKTRWKS